MPSRPPPVAPETPLRRLATGLAEASALAALVVTPLFFNPASERVFEPDKLAWAMLLGLAATVGLVLRVAEGWPPARPRPSAIALGAAFLGLVVVLGTLASAVPVVSWWGSYRRGLGLLAWLALLALLAAAAVTVRGPLALARLRRAALLPVAPVAAYALLQRFGVDSVPWQVAGDVPAARAFGPMGNAILLGGYLAMTLPLVLASLAEAWVGGPREPTARWARLAGYAGLLLLGGAALVASQSRGPTLGLLAGTGVFVVLWAATTGRRRLALGLAGAGLVALGGVALLGQAPAAGLGRLGGLLDVGSRTAQQRFLIWGALADLAASDPARALLGYGPDTAAYVLPAHIPDALVRLTQDQTFDRAHNVVWEWWLTAGVAGVLALAVLYLAALVTGLRLLGLAPGGRGARRAGAALAGGIGLGALVAVLAGQAPAAALAAPLGLVAALALYAALARPGPVAPPAVPTLAVAGIVAALCAHLVDGALGLPFAAGELLFMILVGALAAVARWPTGTTVDRARRRGVPDTQHEGVGVPPWSEGLLEGLALAAVAAAPLLLPRPPTRNAEAGWPLWLLPAAVWLAADLLAEPGAAYGRRAAARLAVLGGFAALFVALAGRPDGLALAFGITLAATTLVLAACLGRDGTDGPATEPWRWLVYVSLILLALVAGWRLALAPALADAHLRAGREAAVSGDMVGAAARFTRAEALWPGQPGLALPVAGHWRDVFLDGRRAAPEREAAFRQADAALRRSFARAPDDAVALRLATLYRDRADRLAGGSARVDALAEAERWYAEALRLFPRNPANLVGHAGLLERGGRWAEAAAVYTDVTNLDPPNLDAWAGRARVAVADGDLSAAAAAIREALALRRDSPADVERALVAGAAAGEGDVVAAASLVIYLAERGDLAMARARLADLAARWPGEARLPALRAWFDQRDGG